MENEKKKRWNKKNQKELGLDPTTIGERAREETHHCVLGISCKEQVFDQAGASHDEAVEVRLF